MVIVAKAVHFAVKQHEGQQRHQTYFPPLQDQVSPDKLVRLIDAYVDNIG